MHYFINFQLATASNNHYKACFYFLNTPSYNCLFNKHASKVRQNIFQTLIKHKLLPLSKKTKQQQNLSHPDRHKNHRQFREKSKLFKSCSKREACKSADNH